MKINRDSRPPVAVAVVGAGAAGLMAAIFAASRGSRVLLLERTRDGGRKILISGGGRCNILPSTLAPEQFVSSAPAPLLRRILRTWSLDGQRRFFEQEVGLPLVLESETGKWFPKSNSARQVRDRLVALAASKGVEVWFDSQVTGIEPGPGSKEWRLRFHDGEPSFRQDGDCCFRRALCACYGKRRHWAGVGSTTGTSGARHLSCIDATNPESGASCGFGWSVAGSHADGRPHWAETVSQSRRIPVHASRLQRARVAEHLASWLSNLSRQADRCSRFRCSGAGWTQPAWNELLSQSPGPVSVVVRRHLPARLVEALLDECNVGRNQSTAQLRRDERQQLVTKCSPPIRCLGTDTKATRKLRSPVGEWLWTNWMRVRSRAGCTPVCFYAEKCWTSSDRLADTTSPGLGSPGAQPDWVRRRKPGYHRSQSRDPATCRRRLQSAT